MEQRERRLSAAEKERYFPGIDWFESFFDSVLTSFAGGERAKWADNVCGSPRISFR